MDECIPGPQLSYNEAGTGALSYNGRVRHAGLSEPEWYTDVLKVKPARRFAIFILKNFKTHDVPHLKGVG